MSVSIIHPSAWIGVPERWPFPTLDRGTFDTPQEWAVALADEESMVEPIEVELRERLISILLMAAQTSVNSGARVYLGFEDGWSGPARVLSAAVRPRADLGGLTLEQVAGFDDPDQLGPPFVEAFDSEAGLAGVRCFRYLPLDDHGVICGRLDYAFEIGDDVLTITGGDPDLVEFEKLKLAAEAFVTVMVVDGQSSPSTPEHPQP